MHIQAVKLCFCPAYQCRKQMSREGRVKELAGVCMNPVLQIPQKENLNGSGRLTGLPWDCLQLWPGVTFLTNYHFACTRLVCEMALHIKQSSLTYISSPKNNTPWTKGCVTEHLNA